MTTKTDCECGSSGSGSCQGADCKCCPWCCKNCGKGNCQNKEKSCKDRRKNYKCGDECKTRCTNPSTCFCGCCSNKRSPQEAAIFWCIIGALIFAILLAFAFILYKTKSKAYMIPKVVYEWTGYTTTYSGLGSKNLQ